MSTELRDLIETEKSSNCCGASMYELGDNYICTDCKEHCEAVSDEEETDRAFSTEQLDFIRKSEAECAKHGCDDNGHKHD